MLLAKVFLGLGLVAGISATPLPLEEKRQQNAPQVVSSIVNTLVTSVNTNIVTINGLVENINKNIGASAAVVAVVNANLDAIQVAFDKATADLLKTTTGAAGGVAVIAQQFLENQAAQLDADIRTIAALVQQISITAGVVGTNLSPIALATVNAELFAVKNAVGPFVAPLEVLVAAVRTANASANLNVNGIREALAGFVGVLNRIISRIFGIKL